MYATFDIDGTLADNSARLHFLAGPVADYLSFFGAAMQDPPFEGSRAFTVRLARENEVVYFTSRAEHYRRSTHRWLRHHGFPPGPLLMRAGPDFRDAPVVKLELLRRLASPDRVAVVLEDDQCVAASLIAAGYTVRRPHWLAPLSADQTNRSPA